MESTWKQFFKVFVGFCLISVGTTTATELSGGFQLLQARGGAISSNSGSFHYYCSSADPTEPGVIVITGADPSCDAFVLTIEGISEGTNVNIYDGSELNQRRTCGTSLNSSTLSYPVSTQGSMITLVVTQPECSTSQPALSCSWTCVDQAQNGVTIEDSGAFVNRHSGSVAYEDLNTAKRYTTAIITEREVCLKVGTEFQEDDVSVDNCQAPSLVVHEIENTGCLTRVYHVCGRKSFFQSENVGANLLAVGTFRPGADVDGSNSYEIRWNEGGCTAQDCPTAPPASTTQAVTESSTSGYTSSSSSASTASTTPESTASTTTASTASTTPESTASTTQASTASTTPKSTASTTPESTSSSTTKSTPVSSTYSTPESTSSSTTEYTTSSTSTSTASPSTSSSTASSSTSSSTSTTETSTTYTQVTSTTASPTTEASTKGPNGEIISRECGGNMLIECGSSGKILYKNETLYNNNERCDWVIHSPSGYVDITFVHQQFENYYDGCVIGEYNTSKPSFGCTKLRSSDYSQTRRTRTPCVIHFTSDMSVTRRGFEIDIVPVGDACIDEHNVYTFHYSDVNGSYRFPAQGSLYDDNARPFGVIQAGQGLPMRSFSYPMLNLEEYYDCTWMYELQPYNRQESCTMWQRICGQYPASTYSPNATAESIVSLAWTDLSIKAEGYELSWTQVPGQYQNSMSAGKLAVQ